MGNIYVIVGYLIALVIVYKVLSLVGGAVKMVVTIIFALISLYVFYVIFGGLIGALT